MENSILKSIKKSLGISAEDSNFDEEVLICINTALFSAQQLGIGPSGFSISSDVTTWTDLLGARTDLAGIKTYVQLKTRLLFDPPQNSFLVEAIKSQISELEVRLNIQVEGGPW